MTDVIVYRFRLRRRTAASWSSLNEVLLDSEIGLESDTKRAKVGDGVTPWNDLPVFGKYLISQTIADEDIEHAPSSDVVHAALALKANASQFASGTLTPDCTGISNAASCSANPCSFTRVGNSVVYSGSVSVTPVAANAASIVSIALPVASNFSSGTDASGPVSGKAAGVPSFEIGQIFAEAGASRLRVHFYPATTNDYTMRFSVVYPIM